MARLMTITLIMLCIYFCYTYGIQRRYFSIIKYRKNLNRNAVKHSHVYRPHTNRLGKWGRRQLIGSWRNLNDSVIEKKLDHMYRKLKDKVNYNVTLKTNGTHFNLGFTENSYLENKHVVGIKDGFLNVNSTLRKDSGDARHEINRIIGKEDKNSLNQESAKEETTKNKKDESVKEKEKDFPQVSWTMRKEDNATENSEKQSEHAQYGSTAKQNGSTAKQNSVSNQSKEKQFKDAATKSGKKTSDQFNKIVKAKDANLFDTQNSDAQEKVKEPSTPKKKEEFKKETDNGSADDQNDADSSELRNDDDSDDATASMSPPREMDSTTLNSEMDVEVGNVDDSPETSNRDQTPNKDLTYDDGGGSGKAPHEENQTHQSKSEKDQSASTHIASNQSNQQKHIQGSTSGQSNQQGSTSGQSNQQGSTSGLNHKQLSNLKVQKMHGDKTNSSPSKANQADENDNGSANEEENTDTSNQSNSALPIYQSTSKANKESSKETDKTSSNTKEIKNSNKNKSTKKFNGEADNAEAVGEESKSTEASDQSDNSSPELQKNTEKVVENSQDTSKSSPESQNEPRKVNTEEEKSPNEKAEDASENTGTENKNTVTEIHSTSSKDENKQDMSSNREGATSITNKELSSEDSKSNKNAETATKENSASNTNPNIDHDEPEKSESAKNNKENTNSPVENKMEKSVNELKSENVKITESKESSNTQIKNTNVEQKESSNNDKQIKNDALKNAEQVLSSYESASANTGENETDEDLYKEPDDQRELNAKETKNGEIKLTGGYDPDEPEGSSIIKDVSSTNKISYSNNDKNNVNIIDDVGNALQNAITTTSNGGGQLSFGKESASTDKSESAPSQKKKEEDASSNDMKLESKGFSKEKKVDEKEEVNAVKPEELHANPAPQSKIEEQFKKMDKMKKMNEKEVQNTNDKAPEKSDSFAETKEASDEKTERTDPEDIHANPAPTSSVEEQFKQMEKVKEAPVKESPTKEAPAKEEKKEDEKEDGKTENANPEDLHKNPGPTSTVEEQFKEMASKAPLSPSDEKNVNLAADESSSSTSSKESKDSKEAVNENTNDNEGPETLHQNPAPTSKVEEQFKELEKQAKERKDQDKKMKMKKGKEAAKDVEISFLESSQESSSKQDAPKEDSKETQSEEKTEPEDLHKNPTPPGKNLQLAKDSIFRFRHNKGAEIHTENDDEGGSATIDDVMTAIEHKNTSQLLEMGAAKTQAHNTLVNPAPMKNNTKMVVKDDDGETSQNGDLMDYNLDHNSVPPQVTVKVASGTGSSSKTTNFHEVGLRAKDDPDDGSNVVSPSHPKKEPVSPKIKNKSKGEKVKEEPPPEIPHLIDMDNLDESLCTVAKKLTVKFRHSNGSLLTIDCGENYNYTSAFDHPPKLTLDRANVNGIYTLLFVDADAPSPLYPIARCTVHWMIVNIMDADLDTGTEIVPYRKPNPQTTTGPHRFAFLLLKQKSLEPRTAFNINVCRLDINEFAFHHNITYIEGFKYFSTQSNIDYLVLTQPQVKSVATKS